MAEADSWAGRAPEAAKDASRARRLRRRRTEGSTRLRAALLLLGTTAGILMVAAELSTIYSIEVLTAGSCVAITDPALADTCVTRGYEQHSYALVLLAGLTILMAWGAGLGDSLPAGGALVVAGFAVLAIGALIDLPDVDRTGEIGVRFEEAEANPGPGFWLELAGGALAVLAGTLRLTRRRRA